MNAKDLSDAIAAMKVAEEALIKHVTTNDFMSIAGPLIKSRISLERALESIPVEVEA